MYSPMPTRKSLKERSNLVTGKTSSFNVEVNQFASGTPMGSKRFTRNAKTNA